MSDRRRSATLVIVGLLWLLMALPSIAMSGSTNDELCGPARTIPQLRCPRTSAAVCVCYLHARVNPAENPPAFSRQAIKITVRRPVPPLLRELPLLEPKTMRDRFYPSVPIRPPR